MATVKRFLIDTLRTGAVATAATTLAVAACGQIEDGNAIAPINTVSHIAWGAESFGAAGPTAKHTLTGLALNAVAVTGWAAVHELLFGRWVRRSGVGRAMIGGAVVSGLAYVIDYHIVPARFTPGFEARLSGPSMFGIYAALALGLAVGSLSRGTRP